MIIYTLKDTDLVIHVADNDTASYEADGLHLGNAHYAYNADEINEYTLDAEFVPEFARIDGVREEDSLEYKYDGTTFTAL